MPGVRIGVGLSIGIIWSSLIAAGTALMATMAPISVCNTRPSIGATVDISTATLWRLEGDRAAPAHSFAVIVRKTALGNSLRRAGPGGG